MTAETLTPVECEREIHRLIKLLESNGGDLVDLRDTYARADHQYRRVYASAIVGSDGKSSKDREAEAQLAAGDAYLEMVVAKAAMDAAREMGHNLRVQLDSLRSINATARYAAGLSR